MFKICRLYAPDYDTANDFLQEGFIKIFNNLHKYKPTGSLGGWMRQVIVNNSIDLLRRDHWSNRHEQFEDWHVKHMEIVYENAFEKELNSNSFFMFLDQLPLGYKTVLNLFYIEDYTHKEIAEKLGITEGTSKSQVSKAKAYLKSILLDSLTFEEIKDYVGGLAKEVV